MTSQVADKATKTNSNKYKRIADHLQRHRRNKRLSIRKVAALSHLPESTIRALENPNRSTLPKSNVVGLYRAYAEVLEVTPRRVNDLVGESDEEKPSFSLSSLPKMRSMVVLSNVGTRVFVGIILSIIAAYAAWQAFGLVSAPSLNIESPMQANVLTNEPSILVSGTSRSETTILVNGEPVVINVNDKTFSQIVYLQEGYNRIRVEAINNFSRSTARDFNVTYVPN